MVHASFGPDVVVGMPDAPEHPLSAMTTTSPAPARSRRDRPEPGAATGSPGRPLGRRPAVPAGRAVVGGLLVTLAAVGTFAAYTAGQGGPTQRYVVARDAVAVGQVLGPDDLRVVLGDLPQDVATEAFTDPGVLDRAVALAPMQANQLVAPAAVRLAAVPGQPPPAHELSIALDRDKALDGRIQRGESIDLVTTYGTGNDAATSVVVRRVPVLDVDTGARAGVGTSAKVTITLGLDTEQQVLDVAHAVEVGKAVVARSTTGADAARGADDGRGPDDPVERPTARSGTGGATSAGPGTTRPGRTVPATTATDGPP